MAQAVSKVERGVVPEIVERILAARGMAADAMPVFLYPDYALDLHDPFLLSDMEPAVERIVAAAAAGERVVVYGDYDIDGITASAVMLETLAGLGVEASSYIPDRFEEGYGINLDALKKLKAGGAQLVISVDCGVTSVEEAAWAREHGLDLIITDHHAAPEVLPDAVAVINPKRPGDEYPFKDLAGVGVAFKLAQALQARAGRPAAGQEKWLLDLVALGTVCDVVTLAGENRVLVSYGIKVMRKTRRMGLRALAEVAGVEMPRINSHHFGFVLGPRMNAAGRLEHAAQSLELVMTRDERRAEEIAQGLDELNRKRRAHQDEVLAAAGALAEQYAGDPVLVLADKDWSHGIVGIVASKLVEKWRKPVLVAQVLGEYTKGSARSYGGFNMVEALRANAHLLSRYGGHFFAAGYTLATGQLEALRKGLGAYYRDCGAGGYVEAPRVADLRLDDVGEVDLALLDLFELLEPYGSGNPKPLVEFEGLVACDIKKMGKEGQHLKAVFADARNRRLQAVGFGLADRYADLAPGTHLTVRGELNKNEYRGTEQLQLVMNEVTSEHN